jgi:hypothetical protein
MTHRPEDAELTEAIEQALPDALAALPDMLPPPPHLDAAVLARPSRAPRPGWKRWTLPAVLVAGVLLGVLGSPAPRPSLVLTDGSHRLEGPATVVLPGGVLELDGVVAVQIEGSREPAGGAVRGRGRTPPTLDPTMFSTRDLLAASSGATVTLALLAGTGTWTPSNASASSPLVTGEPLKVVTATAGPMTENEPLTGTVQMSAPSVDPTTLEAENEELREQVAALDFEVKALRGQLSAYGGTIAEWPDDLPEAFQPEAFTQWAESVAAEVPGFSITEVDCNEFPCLVLILPDADAPLKEDGSIDWHAAGRAFQDERLPGLGEDERSSMGISVMETDDDGDRSGVMALYSLPEDHMTDMVQERLQVRSRDASQRLAERDAPE